MRRGCVLVVKEEGENSMRNRMHTGLKKCISLLMALAVFLQCGILAPIPTRAVTSAEVSGRVSLGDRMVNYHQKLEDNGNGTFTLTLTLRDESAITDNNTDRNNANGGIILRNQKTGQHN